MLNGFSCLVLNSFSNETKVWSPVTLLQIPSDLNINIALVEGCVRQSCMLFLSSIPSDILVKFWHQLEIGSGGSIYTKETAKCYKSGPLPSRSSRASSFKLTAHYWICLYFRQKETEALRDQGSCPVTEPGPRTQVFDSVICFPYRIRVSPYSVGLPTTCFMCIFSPNPHSLQRNMIVILTSVIRSLRLCQLNTLFNQTLVYLILESIHSKPVIITLPNFTLSG